MLKWKVQTEEREKKNRERVNKEGRENDQEKGGRGK